MSGRHSTLGTMYVARAFHASTPDYPRQIATILETLRLTRGNVTMAAQHLGMTRAVLWYYFRRCGLGEEPARIRAQHRRRFKLPGLPATGARHKTTRGAPP